MVNTEYLITITVIFLLSEGLEQDHIAVKIPFRLILYKHQERKRDNGEDLDQLPTLSQPTPNPWDWVRWRPKLLKPNLPQLNRTQPRSRIGPYGSRMFNFVILGTSSRNAHIDVQVQILLSL